VRRRRRHRPRRDRSTRRAGGGFPIAGRHRGPLPHDGLGNGDHDGQPHRHDVGVGGLRPARRPRLGRGLSGSRARAPRRRTRVRRPPDAVRRWGSGCRSGRAPRRTPPSGAGREIGAADPARQGLDEDLAVTRRRLLDLLVGELTVEIELHGVVLPAGGWRGSRATWSSRRSPSGSPTSGSRRGQTSPTNRRSRSAASARSRWSFDRREDPAITGWYRIRDLRRSYRSCIAGGSAHDAPLTLNSPSFNGAGCPSAAIPREGSDRYRALRCPAARGRRWRRACRHRASRLRRRGARRVAPWSWDR